MPTCLVLKAKSSPTYQKGRDGVAKHTNGKDRFAPLAVGDDASDRRADELHERVGGPQPAEIGATYAEVFDIKRQEWHGQGVAKHNH